MSRATKREKVEAQLRTLEGQFSEELRVALRECAAGKWEMFGRNDAVIERQPKPLRDMLHSHVADRLIQTGESIRRLRIQLGHAESFSLFERYMEYRQIQSANSPGEPKLAAQFLAELENQLA